MLLNDVPADKRLSYLLDLSVQRQRRRRSRRVVSMAVLGATALLLFFVWTILTRH